MIINILLILVWICACLIEGTRDSHFFHNRMSATNPDKQNMHWLFTCERFIIWILIVKIYFLHASLLSTGILAVSLSLMFSFFHNGAYYFVRHKLDNNVYPKGWFDSSTTSESFLEFNTVARIFMFITGLIGIITALTM